MKITISYDLPDKIKEAEKGYSLKKCVKRGTIYTGINTMIGTALNLAAGAPPEKYLYDILIYMVCHATIIGTSTVTCKKLMKMIAEIELHRLQSELSKINVTTTYEKLLNSKVYKTEYEPDLKNGCVEQKKYVNIPINDAWGEREMSICQEHMVGSSKWALSLGTPKEAKVYSLGINKALNR